VLARFAREHGITFPLLSDRGSVVIRQYGLLNPSYPPDSRAYGVPYPGTFVLDATGRIVSRHFEAAYQERNTVASILARAGSPGRGPLVAAQSAHLAVRATASDGVVAPGHRITITFDITPARGLHVYAPGKHDYQVIRFQLAPESWLTTHPMVYAPSEIYHFAPLDERVETYQRPFTLRQDVTIAATAEARKALADRTAIAITGRLDYQACDDRVCYAPASLPFTFPLDLVPLVSPK
jgi:hypothetical protein